MSATTASTDSSKADTETKPSTDAAAADAAEDAEAPEVDVSPGPPPVPPAIKRSAPPPPADDAEAPLSVSGHLPVPGWPPQTVADIMTRQVITLKETEVIGDLEGWMLRFRFRHLPVVDASMKLVGLITLTDLLHAILGLSTSGKPIEKADGTTLAGAIMRRNVVTGGPDASLTTAARVMLHEKLGCLPIILPDNTLVGIVTETDFIRLSLDLIEKKG